MFNYTMFIGKLHELISVLFIFDHAHYMYVIQFIPESQREHIYNKKIANPFRLAICRG